MTRPEALQLLIDKCPEIVGPMLPTDQYRISMGAYGPQVWVYVQVPGEGNKDWLLCDWANLTDWFFDALEARMGRWLRDGHSTVILPISDIGALQAATYEMEVDEWFIDGATDSFTAHALAVVELAKEPTND